MQHPKYEVWPYKKVLPEHVQILISRYTSGESARKICLDLPFAEDAAIKVLRDFDIPIKTRKENRFSMGFKINEEAFSDPTEAECAYFYGWLLTDGCLRETKYAHSVTIQLQRGDISVLEALQSYLGLEGRIKVRERYDKRTDKTYSSCNLSFQYAPITERLIRYGLSPRKSTIEFAPPEFTMSSHFWRGVLEGDGYLSKLGSCTKMQICGSENLCSQWFSYCKSVVPDMHMTITPDNKNNGLFHTYSGRFEECKAVLDTLYLGVPEHVRLKRKYDLYVGRYYDGNDPSTTG